MAKKRAVSKNSRAARRATSPSIDTDKSLKDVQPPSSSSRRAERPNVLAVQRSAGISKKVSKRKTQMSAKARRRHEKGLQMAEAVEERTRNKVHKAEGRGKAVDARRREWKDINKEVGNDVQIDSERAGRAAGDEEQEENGWETDQMDAAEETMATEPPAPAVGALDEDLDEIL